MTTPWIKKPDGYFRAVVWTVAGMLLSLVALTEVIANGTDAAPAAEQQQAPSDEKGEPKDPNTPKSPPAHRDNDPSDPNQPPANGLVENGNEEDDDSMFPDAEDMVELFDLFGRIFNDQYITETGFVDYTTLRRKRADLIKASNLLEKLHPAVLMSLNREQRIAFWINTYNTCILKLIIDNYPIQPKWYMILYPSNSIMQIPGATTKVFFRIMGLEYNLKEMRNDLLLDRYRDPRICFALTEAARGGAILRNEPYLPDTLEEQLDDQVHRFLNSPHGLRINRQSNVLHLSNVFSMNKKVFLESEYAEILRFRARKPEERAWLNFLSKYLPQEDAQWLDANDPTIRFIDFDWNLNEK
ncbi:MAG TPA: DUF547 domain-containing protein [Phycisphaerales bacterium]|nr:DUF547 domain-containing protein [Phycisphaerales bacterium]